MVIENAIGDGGAVAGQVWAAGLKLQRLMALQETARAKGEILEVGHAQRGDTERPRGELGGKRLVPVVDQGLGGGERLGIKRCAPGEDLLDEGLVAAPVAAQLRQLPAKIVAQILRLQRL